MLAAGKDSTPPPDVVKLAQLSRLDISAEEVKEFTPKIAAIVDWCVQGSSTGVLDGCVYTASASQCRIPHAGQRSNHSLHIRRFGQLRDVDLEGVAPSLRAAEAGGDRLRPDEVKVFDDRCAQPRCISTRLRKPVAVQPERSTTFVFALRRAAIIKAAARSEPPYIYVPKIQGEPDG